jgi:hypothetical protein
LQDVPAGILPHIMPAQLLPGAHSAMVVHETRHRPSVPQA